MQLTITLTEQEVEFLQNVLKSMNSEKQEQEHVSFDDVVHLCISMVMSFGASMHRGQA